ncbi:MAG: hypothetical protein ABUL77_04490 [Bacteroidota bacterium]
MTLIGCDNDPNCPAGSVCVHGLGAPPSVAGYPITGMCFRRDKAAELRDNDVCRRMLETPRRYEIVSTDQGSSVVIPKLSEVSRPVHLEGDIRVGCNFKMANKVDPYTCDDSRDTANDIFQCVTMTARPDGTPAGIPLGSNDLKRRCLIPCQDDTGCRRGRVCVEFGPIARTEAGEPLSRFCADGAPMPASGPLAERCGLDQLVSYKLGAGGSLVVSGSAVGRIEGITKKPGPKGPVCVIDPTASQARIPMNAALCDSALASAYKDAVTADMMGGKGTVSRWLADNKPQPNPCFIEEGEGASRAVSAFFENSELRFLLTDLQKSMASTSQIRFEVHGGVNPQFVTPSVDAQPGLPARLLLGPIPQPPQPQDQVGAKVPTCLPDESCAGAWSDLPYLFVVDQRAFASGRVGVRGQILRITPRLAEGVPVAGFEGFSTGGRYFPIQ